MSDFPSAIYAPRTIENRPGVVYDADDRKTFFAEDHEQVTGEIVAIENALGKNLGNLGLNGWLPLATIPTLQASDNPVYTLRFGADMTAIIGLGNRIKLTQHGSVKYFIVVAVGAYTGENTDIDVYGGTDYDMENTDTYPVTLPYYSIAKAPFGFPLNPTKWTVEVIDTSNRTQSSPSQNTWYNLGTTSGQITIPKGVWNVEYEVSIGANAGATAAWRLQVALSTSNNSVSDSGFICDLFVSAVAIFVQTVFRKKTLSLASKTLYYLICRTTYATASNISTNGAEAPTILRAVCAYL